MKKIAFGFIFAYSLGLMSCDFSKRLETRGLAQEIREKQVKRVTPAQITAQADEWGKEIVGALNQQFPKKDLVDTLQKFFRIEISIGTVQNLKNPANGLKINEILDAYEYNAEHKIISTDNIQKNEDGSIYYFTSPIIMGEQVKITDKTKLIQVEKESHLDSLSTRKKGDLAGIWLIKFTKNNIIRLMDMKHVKKLNVEGRE
jgi:hypothetical protein